MGEMFVVDFFVELFLIDLVDGMEDYYYIVDDLGGCLG